MSTIVIRRLLLIPMLLKVGHILVGGEVDGSFTFERLDQLGSHSDDQVVMESGPEATVGMGTDTLLPLNVASSYGKDNEMVADLAGMEMSNDKAIYQWERARGLIVVPASSPANENDL